MSQFSQKNLEYSKKCDILTDVLLPFGLDDPKSILIVLIEHLTYQKGPEQLSADHSALINVNQLISDIKDLGTVA